MNMNNIGFSLEVIFFSFKYINNHSIINLGFLKDNSLTFLTISNYDHQMISMLHRIYH